MSPLTPLERMAQPPEETHTWPEQLYWLWLADLMGPANIRSGDVLDDYGTAEEAWRLRDTPEFADCIGKSAAARLDEGRTPADFAELAERCADKGIRVIPYNDEAYPDALTRIPDPPLVLYCTGDPSVLKDRVAVGIVGTRRPTSYGVEAAARIGGDLAEAGALIVSGLADGLDGESHRAALRKGGMTVGVLGVPIDMTYPAANAQLRAEIENGRGCILSEYAPGAGQFKEYFLQRNRIIAALSDVLLVVEARVKSGTMSTVAHALRYGRTVYAVPGSIFSPLSEGTNALLCNEKAKAITDAAPLAEKLGLAVPSAKKRPAKKEPQEALPPNAQLVLKHIGAQPVGPEELVRATGLAAPQLLGTLSLLEMSGKIRACPGRKYVLR